jgi:hypothetical protein
MMSTYESITDLNDEFVGHKLNVLPDQIVLNDVTFNPRESLMPDNVSEMVTKHKKVISLYTAAAGTKSERIALVWSMRDGLVISPLVAKLIGKYRANTSDTVMKEGEAAEKEPTIGGHIEVVLMSFNQDKPIRGKVDTGATICSLHAEHIDIKSNQYEPDEQVASFIFNDAKYVIGLEQHQSVQSADGGVEYRPVIKFTVKHGETVVPDVLFNLNDRSGMEDQLLIGMNLLDELGLLIDPKMEAVVNDDVISADEWNWILEQVNLDCPQHDTHDDSEAIHRLYEQLMKQNISFADLLRHVKQHTIQVVEHLES